MATRSSDPGAGGASQGGKVRFVASGYDQGVTRAERERVAEGNCQCYDFDGYPGKSVSISQLRSPGPRGKEVRSQPGAGDYLVRLAPLIRPLVELRWTRMVAQLNGVVTDEHFFPHDHVGPHCHRVLGRDSNDVSVIGGVVDLAHGDSIGDNWFASLGIRNYMGGIEEPRVPEAAKCTLAVVGGENSLAKEGLMESSHDDSFCI